MLAGSPRRMVLVGVQPGADARLVLPPEATPKGGDDRPPKLRVSRRTGRVRVKLPRGTPPGVYQATLESEGSSHSVQVEVAPDARVRAYPTELAFTAAAGAEVKARATLLNEGNVTVKLPDHAFVGLFDDDGVEHAFADTYRQTTEDPIALLGHFIKALRDESYGGLLKLTVAEGAGELPPGAERSVRLTGALPGKLKPGRGYHGVLTLHGLNWSVTVQVDRNNTSAERKK